MSKASASSPLKTNASSPVSPLVQDDKASVAVFFDNSNIWIEGCKVYMEREETKAHKRHTGKLDYRWRMDFVKLIDIVARGRRHVVPPHMYCSFTPEGDDMTDLWKRFSVLGKVKSYKRSAWTQKEKMVDIALMSNAHIALRNNGDTDALVLISGDGDFKPFIEDVLENYPTRVEIWSWRQSISLALRRLADEHPERVQINFIDDVMDEISFLATEWDPRLRVPHDKAMVVRNLNDKMEEMIIRGGPYRVHKLPDSDFAVIIYEFGGFKLNSLIDALRKVAASERDVTSFVLWKGQQISKAKGPSLAPPSPAVNNQYGALMTPATPQDPPTPSTPQIEAQWTAVVSKTNKVKSAPLHGSDLCLYGVFCDRHLNCNRAHFKRDQQYFKLNNGPKAPKKTKPCTRLACARVGCDYVHPGEKTVCLTCGEAFLTPHVFGQCPAIKRSAENKKKFIG